MTVMLSAGERIIYELIRDMPGCTTHEIWTRLRAQHSLDATRPSLTKKQVAAIVGTALYRTKSVVTADTNGTLYRWFIKEENDMERHFNDPYPTKHFIERMNERDIKWAEVIDIVERPEVVYGPDMKGRKTMQKGDLCVVVAADGGVITVLLRQEEQWTDEELRTRGITP